MAADALSSAGTSQHWRRSLLGHGSHTGALVMAYEPEGAVENVGDSLGIFRARVENTVEDFKKFIESRGRETGAWRGEVDKSRPM